MKFNKPTLIGDKNIYLLVSPPTGSIEKPEITIKKVPGKLTSVVFRGISVQENSDDAIIIYKINGQKGNSPLGKFTVQQKTVNNAVMPDNETSDGLPAIYVDMNFTSIVSKMPPGVQQITISFALYTLSDNSESQQLYGYYCFNTDILINA